METRELGRSGVSVTRIVLGCGNFGGVGSSPAFFGQGIPYEEAPRIMDAAWELGIRTFDTADAYGGGRSEAWIGEWLATKGSDGPRRDHRRDEDVQPDDRGRRQRPRRAAHPPPGGVEPRRGSASNGSRCTWPTTSTPTRRRRRRSRRWTSSSARARSARWGLRTSRRSSWPRPSRSPSSRGSRGTSGCRTRTRSSTAATRETVFSVCHEHGLGYEAFGPLAGGWLAGRYRRGTAYPEGSRMTQRPDGYRKYESDGIFDALEAFESAGVGSRGFDGRARNRLAPRCARGDGRRRRADACRAALMRAGGASVQLAAEEHADLRGLFP